MSDAPTKDNSSGASLEPHPSIPGRFIFLYNHQPIYEWEQTLNDVTLYITKPPSVPTKNIICNIQPNHLQLGQKVSSQSQSQPFFLDEDLFETIDAHESTWTCEDNEIVIYLQKAAKGKVWKSALKGRVSPAVQLNDYQLQQIQQQLLLERWQEEHGGMDFRGAKFNGSAPDPRTFMGGVSYD